MAKRVTFKKKYDHKWPSGAVTCYKAGLTDTVKDEVAEGAAKVGALEGSPEQSKDKPVTSGVDAAKTK